VTLTTQDTFIQAFRTVPGCQTCVCKRGIEILLNKMENGFKCLS